MKYNIDLILITILEFLLGIGALVGGLSFLNDPTGVSMFEQDLRQYIIVPDFFIPGLILIFGFGICTFLFIMGLWLKYRIAWIGALIISLSELLWILIQLILLYSVGFIIWQLIIPAIAIITIIFLFIKQNREIYFTNAKMLFPKYHI